MPLQSIISRDAFNSIDRAAAAGNAQARDLVSYFVGQGVGLIDSGKSASAVVQEFKEDFVEAAENMNALGAGEIPGPASRHCGEHLPRNNPFFLSLPGHEEFCASSR